MLGCVRTLPLSHGRLAGSGEHEPQVISIEVRRMTVREDWTRSEQAVVVSADLPTIRQIANELDLQETEPVNVDHNLVALPLWGYDLDRYMRLRGHLVYPISTENSNRRDLAFS